MSYWVHDDLRVTAMAIEDLRTHKITVLVSSDLYMIFRNDADGIRRKVMPLVTRGEARRLTVIVTATHNHEGPDTAFDVNHAWYEHMTDQAAAAVADAVDHRTRASLYVASGEHWFGANETWSPGCQSWVSTTLVKFAAIRLIAGTTFSPPGTASAPPVQKSFCTSITSSTSRSEICIARSRSSRPARRAPNAPSNVDLLARLRNHRHMRRYRARRTWDATVWRCPS